MKDRGSMILHFRGSDYKRSSGSTWYDRMDSLLVILGVTESKEDSNHFLKVEGGRPVTLLLYVNDLFLIEVGRRRLAAEFKMKDLDMMHYFLGMEVWQNLPGTREVCSRDPKKVLLRLQHSPKILKNFGTLLYFDLSIFLA